MSLLEESEIHKRYKPKEVRRAPETMVGDNTQPVAHTAPKDEVAVYYGGNPIHSDWEVILRNGISGERWSSEVSMTWLAYWTVSLRLLYRQLLTQ